jgi:hypothetical protein
VTDPEARARIARIQQRLKQGMGGTDPHHRLAGRPLSYKVIAGQTLELLYDEVPGINESEIQGLKRVVGEECFISVAPQTAETLQVRVVVRLK